MKTKSTLPTVNIPEHRMVCDATTSPTFESTDNHTGPALMRAAAATVLPILLAFSSLTCGISYGVEPTTSKRFSTSSVISPFRRRSSRRISLSDAQRIALEVLRQANFDLQQERISEARFVFRFWDEQND